MKTTNYINTFIQVADDCPALEGVKPPCKSNKITIATMQYELLINSPYKYTSDDVFFYIYAKRNDIAEEDYPMAREEFYSKGQPCFRASPLTKKYGWGVHSDENSHIAIYAVQSKGYKNLANDEHLTQKKAMKSKR